MGEATISYYDKNASAYVSTTVGVSFSEVQNRFLEYMPSGSIILDFGCGSGRDTKYFIDKGYVVDAIDGSSELVKLASDYTGVQVKHMKFSELSKEAYYDGIWACASILHLPRAELSDVFSKMITALKDGGVIYTSFKYGDFEGNRGDRYFTDFTEKSFNYFLKAFPDMKILESWISTDVRPGRGEEKWLNLVIKKVHTVCILPGNIIVN